MQRAPDLVPFTRAIQTNLSEISQVLCVCACLHACVCWLDPPRLCVWVAASTH